MLFGEGIRNTRSSAYKMSLFSGKIVDISLMYIRIKKVPSAKPWGTPCLLIACCDLEFRI